jgi:hypothetical protein
MRSRIAALTVALVMSGGSARAWFGEGHMMVAEIAWQSLTPASRVRVSALLRRNPDHGLWVRGVAADRRDEVAFVTAATWADVIKESEGHALVYTNDGERPRSPDSGRNIGYEDRLQHRYWHFVDTPFSTDGTALEPPAVPNAETQIRMFEAAIASRDVDDDIKSYDLVWLEHLVGDVHQPLHAASRFSRSLRRGDRGGNAVLLCRRPCWDELHLYWDGILGDSDDPEQAIEAARKLARPDARAAAIGDEHVWIEESFAIARRYAYEAPIGPGRGPYTLDGRYQSDARAQAMQRIALAGVRLAHLINAKLR